jgi:alpha-tubulin suppressor-like RCC1 family protein
LLFKFQTKLHFNCIVTQYLSLIHLFVRGRSRPKKFDPPRRQGGGGGVIMADSKEVAAAAAEELRQKKMKQMSRALGVDIAQVAKILEGDQSCGGSGGVEESSPSESEAKPAAAAAVVAAEEEEPKQEGAEGVEQKEGGAGGNKMGAVEAGGDGDEKSAVAKAGAVVFFGGVDWEKIGSKKTEGDVLEPHTMKFPEPIVKVCSGPAACHSVVIDDKGTAYAWGRGMDGQLGSGSARSLNIPTPIKVSVPVVMASCGKAHTALVLEDGRIMTAGAGVSGQLGTGHVVAKNKPVTSFQEARLPGGARCIKVACGAEFTVALSRDGRIFSCGHPEHGQLGNGTNGEYFITASKLSHHFVASFEEVRGFCSKDSHGKVAEEFPDVLFSDISCGRNHTLAIERSDSRPRIFSWGFAGYGRLGHAGQQDEYYPRVIQSLMNMGHIRMARIAAGASCSLATTVTGTLFYWGKHKNQGEAVMYPKIVDELGQWNTHCMAGSNHCVLVGSDTSVIAWGNPVCGELGFGDGSKGPKSSSKPRKVDDLEGVPVLGVAMGYAHTLLLVDTDDKADAEHIETLPVFEPPADPAAATAAAGGKKNKGGGAAPAAKRGRKKK